MDSPSNPLYPWIPIDICHVRLLDLKDDLHSLRCSQFANAASGTVCQNSDAAAIT